MQRMHAFDRILLVVTNPFSFNCLVFYLRYLLLPTTTREENLRTDTEHCMGEGGEEGEGGRERERKRGERGVPESDDLGGGALPPADDILPESAAMVGRDGAEEEGGRAEQQQQDRPSSGLGGGTVRSDGWRGRRRNQRPFYSD
jgi:hypothetical protein